MKTGTHKGYTIPELVENGRTLAEKLRKGEIPEGTSPEDWMIVKGVAVHTPFIPLYQTCDLSSKDVDCPA